MKSVIPLIYFHSIDDFEAVRARHAVEAEWYRARGEDGWEAERLAHLGFAEFRAGRWDLAEQLVEDSCTAIAQLERPGPWTMPFRLRSFVDAARGRTERARRTMWPLIEEAQRSERTLWEALFLSTLAFVEFADDQHAAVDAALTRMYRCTEKMDIRDLVLIGASRSTSSRWSLSGRSSAPGRRSPGWRSGTQLPEAVDRRDPAAYPRGRPGREGELDKAFIALDALDVDVGANFVRERVDLLVRGRLTAGPKQRRAAAEALRAALEQFERLRIAMIERTRAELDRVGLRRAPAEPHRPQRRAGRTRRERSDEPGGREPGLHEPEDGSGEPGPGLSQAGHQHASQLGARMAQEGRRTTAQT